jgi:hypothetical protein
VIRRGQVAGRISTGSGLLGRRIRRRLTRWIAKGRRADLTGLPAVLGCIVRAGLLLLAAYLLARFVRALPAVLWPAWCIAAYRAAPKPAKKAPEPAEEDATEEAPPDPRAAFARWLLQTIGQRRGIHLRELYPAMRQLSGHEALDDAALRAALRTLGVPVERSMRVGAVAGRSGVRRADVQALLPPGGEQAGETGGDAGQAADSPVLSTAGEWAESA